MATTRFRIGKQNHKSVTPRSLVYTDGANEQKYFAPPSGGGDFILKWDGTATDLTWLSTAALINIYNNDGTLSDNRILTGGNKSLTFDFNDGGTFSSQFYWSPYTNGNTVHDTATDYLTTFNQESTGHLLTWENLGTGESTGLTIVTDTVNMYRFGLSGQQTFNIDGSGMVITDSELSQGMKYGANYASYFATNPRSIPDVGYINSLIAAIPNLWTDAGVFTRLTSTTDRLVIGSATELDTNYRLQISGSIISTGNIALPTTTSTAGIVLVNGQRALHYLNSNTFLGINSGNLTHTGTENTGIGYTSLSSVTTGSYNNAFGLGSGQGITTGSENTAFGRYSLANTTTGGSNVGIGNTALYSNIGGGSNVAIGFNAMRLPNGPSNNVAIGTQAMYQAGNTVAENIAIGTSALYRTTGSNNTGIGHSAGSQITSGAQNTVIGRATAASLSTGSDNVLIGEFVAFSLVSGNSNTFIGTRAGFSSTGSSNVFIGYQSGYSETGSNKLYISNSNTVTPLIYGDFSTGRLGILVNTPTAKLHLPVGATASSSAPLKFTTSGAALTTVAEAGAMEVSGDRIYYTQPTGPTRQTLAYLSDTIAGVGTDTQIAYYVGNQLITSEGASGLNSFTWDYNNNRLGIRVSSPLSTLHLNNSTDTSAYAIFTGALTGATNVTSLALNRTAGSGSLDLVQSHTGTGDNCIILQGNGTGDMFYRVHSTGPSVTYSMGIDASDSYVYKITNGASPSLGSTLFSGIAGRVGIRTNPHGTQEIYLLGTLRIDLGSDAQGDIYYRNAAGATVRLPLGSSGDVLTVVSGLPAWQAPSGAGSVTGTGVAGQVSYWSGTSSQAGTNNFFWDTTNNRLGIGGTTTPVARLHVVSSALGTTPTVNSGIYISNDTAATAGNQQISPSLILQGNGWKTASTAASQSMAFRWFVTPIQGTSAPTSFLGLGSSVNGFYTDDQFIFTNGGAFAIGTTSPAATAIVDLTSTTRGMLVPRMTTTQKNAISSPANGLLLYDNTLNKLSVYESSAWVKLGDGIYNGSGSLSTSTMVTMGSNLLRFSATPITDHDLTVDIDPSLKQFYVSSIDSTGAGLLAGELIIGEGFASIGIADDIIPGIHSSGISFAGTGTTWNWGNTSIIIDSSGLSVTESGGIGIVYTADYSSGILSNNRSLTDMFTVRENAIENYNTITTTSSPANLNGVAPDYLIAQGGTQATFTFSLPATPDNGEVCKLTFSTAVTALTITAQGGITILGTAATTAAVGTQIAYKYYSTINAWIRIK